MAGITDWFIDSCGCECLGAGQEVELHSDYAIKVTPLYKAVENLQWASVNNFLKTGFWKNSFFADPVKPDIQMKTWMVRYEEINAPSDNVNSGSAGSRVQKPIKRICWKQLPMHAAIVHGAPAIIIQKFINVYPKALRCADNRGNLPIHLAFRHGSNDAVLALLLQEYPEGMNCRESNGLLPTECATQLPSPQPLRGALLKAASPRNGKDRLQLVKQLSNDRLFFDERAITPNRGNLSPKKDRDNAPPSQFSLLSQQMESLRDTVTRALSKSDTGVDTPVATNTTATTVKTSASHELTDSSPFFPSSSKPASSSSPPVANTKTSPLSPTALESLQDIVSQTLAGSFSHFAVDPDDMDSVSELSAKNLSTAGAVFSSSHNMNNNNAGGVRHPNPNHLNQPSYHQQNNNNWLRDAYDPMELPQNSILDTTGGGGYNTSIPQPQAMLPQLQGSWEPQNHLYGQQQQQQHPHPQMQQYIPTPRTGSYDHMNTQQQTQFHQPPPPPQLYNLVSPPHHVPPQQQQQQGQQAFQSQKLLQEQQQKLDDEVRIMEEKMTTMELAMKQMHQREKTVRKELAMTVQEMRLWKEKANKATVEEEKNRILTEMLQKFASSPRVQPQEQTHQSSLTTQRHSNKNKSVSKSLSKRHSRSNDDETDDDESEPPVTGNVMPRNKSGIRPAAHQKSPSRHKSPKRRSPPVPEATDDENESETPLTPAELEQVYRMERKKRQQRTTSPKRSASRRRGGGSRDDDDDYNYKAQPQDQRDDMGGGGYYDQTVDRYNNSQQRQRSPLRGNNKSKIKSWNSGDEPPAVPLHRVNGGKMYGAPPPPPPPKRTVGFAPGEQSGPMVADHLLMRRPRSHQSSKDPNAAIRITRQHRSYGDPLGTHLESDSQVPGYGYEEDADSSHFSESMMEKIAGLQNRQGHPHEMTAIEYHRQQQQRQLDAEIRYSKSSAWKPAGPPRDPSEIHTSRGVNLSSMMKQRYQYNQNQHVARPNPSAASYSQSSVSGSDSDFFPRE